MICNVSDLVYFAWQPGDVDQCESKTGNGSLGESGMYSIIEVLLHTRSPYMTLIVKEYP